MKVDNVLPCGPRNALEEVLVAQKECIYQSAKREPLGKPITRNMEPPACARENPNFAFGVTTKKSESAKVAVHSCIKDSDSDHGQCYYFLLFFSCFVKKKIYM